ncbi:MAG: hypothetical protein JOZ54_25765 [Acidobacteria bacterium]|nr:hypothetical protein [Acidobacteriota bacterium]
MTWLALVLLVVVLTGAAIGLFVRRRRRQRFALVESLFLVRVDDAHVTVRDPEGEEETIAWDDLQRIVLHTTDGGPDQPDILWELHPAFGRSVMFPSAATGEVDFMYDAQKLPGFRDESLVRAMTSAENGSFLVWERE